MQDFVRTSTYQSAMLQNMADFSGKVWNKVQNNERWWKPFKFIVNVCVTPGAYV